MAVTEDCFTGATEEGKYRCCFAHSFWSMSEGRIWSCKPQECALVAQVKALLAIWVKIAALGLELSFWSHRCALNPRFAWEANGLGVQLHFRSKATKMHFLAFSHVLRRLFGNWTEPVCEWEDPALAGLSGHMAKSMAQHPWVLGWELQRHSPVARSPYWGKSLGNGQVSFSAALSQAETLLDLQQPVEQSRRAEFSC